MSAKLLRIITAAGFLALVAYSHELWFGVAREFPRAPLLFELPLVFERILAVVLAVSLISSAFSTRRLCSAVAVGVFLLLAAADQTRLQPWAYQFSLILVILTFTDDDDGFSLIGILIAALYVWSGIQKLNHTFAFETMPMLLAPFGSFAPNVPAALAVGLTESVIGFGLLIRKTRKIAVVAAVFMHFVILFLLIAAGRNQVVWIWNAVLILLVTTAFWRFDSCLTDGFKKTRTPFKVVVAAVVLLPVLSFAGLWDSYLSGALYSGNVAVAAIRVDEESLSAFPESAQKVVITTKNGERFVPLFEWSIEETNVPVYPEERVFRRVFKEICGKTGTVEMIVKKRPGVLDGKFEIERLRCAAVRK